MITELEKDTLQARKLFLTKRADAYGKSGHADPHHRVVSATLLRDAAATSLILGEIPEGKKLLRRSGQLLLNSGLIGGLQLLFLAGGVTVTKSTTATLNEYEREFFERTEVLERRSVSDRTHHFTEESFRTPHLLRAYQGLEGAGDKWASASDGASRGFLTQRIREVVARDGTMPIGINRVPLITYLHAFDMMVRDTSPQSDNQLLVEVLRSFARRRQEVVTAAARDTFHWRMVLRPADLIDFDLLALLLAGTIRGNRSLIQSLLDDSDPVTSLPWSLALRLGGADNETT